MKTKKQSIILIFIGIVIGLTGISIPIFSSNGSGMVQSASVPIGPIAAAILVLIGGIQLFKRTINKKTLTATIIYAAASFIEVVVSIIFVAQITTIPDFYIEFSSNMNQTITSAELNELITVLEGFSTTINIMLLVLTIPYVAKAISLIMLTSSFLFIGNNYDNQLKVKKYGFKYNLTSIILYVCAALSVFLIFYYLIGALNELYYSYGSGVIPTKLSMLFIILFLLIIPALTVFGVFSIVYMVKFIIAMCKLIADIDKPKLEEQVDNELVEEVIDELLDNEPDDEIVKEDE